MNFLTEQNTASMLYSFPFCVSEWSSLGNSMREDKSINHFQSMLIQFFTLKQRKLFSIHGQIVAKLVTRLRLKLSHLSKFKFCHKFKDCLRPMCNCGTEIETSKHSFIALPILCQ